MSDLDALLAAVLAAPDDDLPRLVAADYLDETGDPARAAFIRTQIALANTPPWEPPAVHVRTAQPGLVTGEHWRPTLPPPPYMGQWPTAAFRRGFGWAVRLNSLLGVLEDGGRLFDTVPVGELHLPTATRDEWELVGRAGWLSRVRAVRFFGTRTPVEPMRMLAESPLATGLEFLRFEKAGGPGLDEVVSGLMQSAVGRRIRGLAFEQGDRRWLPDLLDALTAGPVPPPLESLRLLTMPLAEPEAERLAASPAADRLTELALVNSPLGGGGLRPLAGSPRLRNVQSLDLRGCRLTADDVAALAGSPHMANLRRLDLGLNSIGADGLAALAESPHLAGLRSLRLRQSSLDDEAALRLASAPFWPGLVELDLGRNWLTDVGAAALIDAPLPPDLTAIHLDGNGFLATTEERLAARFGERLRMDGGPVS